MPEDVRSSMGLSKVMTMTCTYDHRVIQGAESGMFLARVQALLEGEDGFFDQIFRDLAIPAQACALAARSGHGSHGQRRSLEASRRRPPDQGLARARASGGRYRSSGLAASVASGSGAFRARADNLGSRPHVSRRIFRRAARCARCSTVCARPMPARPASQYMHIDNREERKWIQERLESAAEQFSLDAATQRRILKDVVLTRWIRRIPRQPLQRPQALLDRRRRNHDRDDRGVAGVARRRPASRKSSSAWRTAADWRCSRT